MSQTLDYGFAGDRHYARYYRHSGKVTLRGILSGIGAGTISAFGLAWTYAYADVYIPIVYAHVFLAIAFGGGVGLATAGSMYLGKVRNAPLALTTNVTFTLLAYYACWAAWLCVTIDRFSVSRRFGFFDLLLRPRAIFELAKLIGANGTWSIGHSGEAVRGPILWMFWLVEAVAIIGTSIFASKSVGVDKPFCEACQRWATPVRLLGVIAPGDVAATRLTMESGDWATLAEAAIDSSSGGHRWLLQFARCATCDDLYLLTMVDARDVIDRQGKWKTKRKTLINRLRVSVADVDTLREAIRSNAVFHDAETTEIATAASATPADPSA